jgi:mersacidin/lichenicidin family type 2 lantibiotic
LFYSNHFLDKSWEYDYNGSKLNPINHRRTTMKRNGISVIRAWKDPEYRASLSADQRAMIPPMPSGDYEVDEEVMENSSAGAVAIIPSWIWTIPSGSEGIFCTISGECSESGESCNPFFK